MAKFNGGCGWGSKLKVRKAAQKKRLEARTDDALVGPREAMCGVSGYAGRADGRYICWACGNYHDKPTGEPQ